MGVMRVMKNSVLFTVSASVRVEILILTSDASPVGHMHLHKACNKNYVWRSLQPGCAREDYPVGTVYSYVVSTPQP